MPTAGNLAAIVAVAVVVLVVVVWADPWLRAHEAAAAAIFLALAALAVAFVAWWFFRGRGKRPM